MSKKMAIAGMAVFLLFTCTQGKAAEEEKAVVSANLGVFNKYLFRGYELSDKSVVFQPSLGAAYKGFSINFWGNIDSDEHATQSFVPDRPGRKSFNETDLTMTYTYAIGKLDLTGGYIYYATKYAAETEEVYVSLSYHIPANPTLAIYRDIAAYPGTYLNLSLSQSWKIYKEVSLDVGASAGYFWGDSGYWRTFDSSTGGYTGEKYRALHDGMIKAGVTVPVTKNLALQPVVQYWFPLSSKAKRTVGGISFNPSGKLDDSFVAGINLAYSY